jgi:hypothetical protein
VIPATLGYFGAHGGVALGDALELDPEWQLGLGLAGGLLGGLIGFQIEGALTAEASAVDDVANAANAIDDAAIDAWIEAGVSTQAGPTPDPGLAAFVSRLEEAGIRVRSTNVQMYGENGSPIGEVDIVTDNALIQYKDGSASAHEIIRQVRDRTEPYVNRPVIAFVNNTTRAGERTVAGANRNGVMATNSFDALVALLKD